MNQARTSFDPVDLDDLERQLREAARPANANSAKAKGDPLAELARIVGDGGGYRDLLGKSGAGEPVAYGRLSNPSGPSSSPARDIEDSIAAALRADAESHAQRAEWAPSPAPGLDRARDFDSSATARHDGYDADAYAPQPEDFGGYDAPELDESGLALEPVAEPARKRTGLRSPRSIAIAIPIVLATIGVAAAYVARGGAVHKGGDAPIIAAEGAPVKILPTSAQAGDGSAAQAALDRAKPAGSPGQSVVLAKTEAPVDVVAAAKAAAPRPVMAAGQPPASSGVVVVPGPAAPSSAPVVVASAGAGAPPSAASVPLPDPPQSSGAASLFGAPRRVSTVAVKPDGTIVPNSKPKGEVTAAAAPAPKTVASASAVVTDAVPVTASLTPASKKTSDATTRPKPAAPQSAVADKPAPKPLRPPRARNDAAEPTAVVANAAGPLSITPRPRAGRTVVASVAPVATAAANAGDAAGQASGFAVQLASSTSEGDAKLTLARLQKQFPDALGGRSADIRRADLGDKGVFYRVRIGNLSRDDASRICTQMKTAGANCILSH